MPHPFRQTVSFAGFAFVMALAVLCPGVSRADDQRFEDQIRPILEERCFACHGNGIKKGGVDLDGVALATDRKLWWAVLKNVRAGIMPPAEKPQPTVKEKKLLEDWIKSSAFGIDPADPDPGRVTVRRLNRIEYRNTVRDLIGVDYDTASEFPPDDTGYGFDNIGDVLTLSPLLLEKYLAAANTIVSKAVPSVSKVIPEKHHPGRIFHRDGDKGGGDSTTLSYYEPAKLTGKIKAEHDGNYRLALLVSANERFVDGSFDYNKCRLIFRVDGEELFRKEFVRQDGKPFRFEYDRDWKAGEHELTIEIEPLTPDEKRVRSLMLHMDGVNLVGPMDQKYWTTPSNHARFFPDPVPDDAAGRRKYAGDLLGKFATRAFRRPVEDTMKDRLVTLAESTWTQPGQSFESGISRAMVAILASPRFLFREEGIEPDATGPYAPVDEYALASRLSYFLWSTMPDDELIRLASEHKLRTNLKQQVGRMLADSRSREFIRHFVGQWLQARDIDSVIINAGAVISRDEVPDPEAERRRTRFRELNRKPADELTDAEKKELQDARATFGRSFGRFKEFELNGELRNAMKRETEMVFEHVMKGDRSLLELLDSNYTFLNERLAKQYGIAGVQGNQMRKVDLPEGSPRGGILTQGTILAITSNPDRTSPVKRGLFILDNVLGSPPAPPPPNIPSLEEAGKKLGGRPPTNREAMVLHRSDPSCASCHSRMDPIGLSLENFNALGRWREKERAGEIDASGKLITGEPFQNVRELKKVLVQNHRRDFYRCLSEKMLTYAIGRGLDTYDVHTVDAIVDHLEKGDGHASTLIEGIIESAPFQKRRSSTADHAELNNPSR